MWLCVCDCVCVCLFVCVCLWCVCVNVAEAFHTEHSYMFTFPHFSPFCGTSFQSQTLAPFTSVSTALLSSPLLSFLLLLPFWAWPRSACRPTLSCQTTYISSFAGATTEERMRELSLDSVHATLSTILGTPMSTTKLHEDLACRTSLLTTRRQDQ